MEYYTEFTILSDIKEQTMLERLFLQGTGEETDGKFVNFALGAKSVKDNKIYMKANAIGPCEYDGELEECNLYKYIWNIVRTADKFQLKTVSCDPTTTIKIEMVKKDDRMYVRHLKGASLQELYLQYVLIMYPIKKFEDMFNLSGISKEYYDKFIMKYLAYGIKDEVKDVDFYKFFGIDGYRDSGFSKRWEQFKNLNLMTLDNFSKSKEYQIMERKAWKVEIWK